MSRSGPSRIILTIRSLLVMGGLGAFLTVYNIYTSHRDMSLALGPQSPQQEQFFIDAADRPDIKVFYRKLSERQKAAVATNIGRYQDAALAKLCAILLGDFSNEARAILTKSLTNVGKAHPDAVAKQLAQTGSFEQFGIKQALTILGSAAVPDVVQTLGDDKMRPNAEDLLVSEGAKTIPVVLPLLDSPDSKMRLAAVEILGKLRADAATAKITSMYRQSSGPDQQPYLVAIASIADPSSEGLLSTALADPNPGPYLRTQAALGLGRIASPNSVSELWKFAQSSDSEISEGCLSALLLCKDKALTKGGESEDLRLKVAAGIRSPASDQVIRSDLAMPTLQLAAAKAASGRPGLVPDLAAFLGSPRNQQNGLLADSVILSLLSTPEGKKALGSLASKPLLAGLIERRKMLGAG